MSFADRSPTMEQAPPLAPELWNCGALAVIVGLLGWGVRLLRLLLKHAEMRHAVRQEATVYLRDLGPSIEVLQYASMWHLQQLLRIKTEPTAARMPRVHVPFELPAASLQISRWLDDVQRPKMALSMTIQSTTKCAVQVLWNVRTDALERPDRHGQPHGSHHSDSLKVRVPRLRSSVLRRLGMAGQAGTNHTLPWVLSPVRRQNRRHRLDDDRDGESPKDTGGTTLARLMGDAKSFSSHSKMELFDEEGLHDYTAEIPVETLFAPHDSEVASLVEEAESDDIISGGPTPGSAARSTVDSEPRYGAVIIVGSPDIFLDDSSESKLTFPWRAGSSHSKRSSSLSHSDGLAEEAVCEYIAVDFLPTPSKAEKFLPSIVKRVVFTQSSAYTLQEIFGREANAGGECVICLEGALEVVLLPCRHQCVCRVCLKEIDRCPICRAKFSTYVCLAEADGAATSSAHVEVKVVDPL